VAVALAVAGCGAESHTAPGTSPTSAPPAALVAQARPIGRGAGFEAPVTGPVLGPCRPRLGPRSGVHVELFAANRVVLIPAGIGTRPPRRLSSGRITGASCFGKLVTLDPTGVVLVAPGTRAHLADLFRSWGEPLTPRRLAFFRAGTAETVRAFVDGTPWRGAVAALPLRAHAEIVLEVGPYVPPHTAYTFPPGT